MCEGALVSVLGFGVSGSKQNFGSRKRKAPKNAPRRRRRPRMPNPLTAKFALTDEDVNLKKSLVFHKAALFTHRIILVVDEFA